MLLCGSYQTWTPWCVLCKVVTLRGEEVEIVRVKRDSELRRYSPQWQASQMASVTGRLSKHHTFFFNFILRKGRS